MKLRLQLASAVPTPAKGPAASLDEKAFRGAMQTVMTSAFTEEIGQGPASASSNEMQPLQMSKLHGKAEGAPRPSQEQAEPRPVLAGSDVILQEKLNQQPAVQTPLPHQQLCTSTVEQPERLVGTMTPLRSTSSASTKSHQKRKTDMHDGTAAVPGSPLAPGIAISSEFTAAIPVLASQQVAVEQESQRSVMPKTTSSQEMAASALRRVVVSSSVGSATSGGQAASHNIFAPTAGRPIIPETLASQTNKNQSTNTTRISPEGPADGRQIQRTVDKTAIGSINHLPHNAEAQRPAANGLPPVSPANLLAVKTSERTSEIDGKGPVKAEILPLLLPTTQHSGSLSGAQQNAVPSTEKIATAHNVEGSSAHVLQRMDMAAPSGAVQLRADARRLDVGVESASLGWVEVRATTSASGHVDATLHVQSDVSAHALANQSKDIADYAREHSVQMGQVSVGVGTGDSTRGNARSTNQDARDKDGVPIAAMHSLSSGEEAYSGSDALSLISVRA